MSPKVGMGAVRREQIVRATTRCLAREGYARLTMKKVAREAGVSQGILHYDFADKRAILTATLEAVSRDLDRRVAAAQSRMPPREMTRGRGEEPGTTRSAYAPAVPLLRPAPRWVRNDCQPMTTQRPRRSRTSALRNRRVRATLFM